MNRRSLRATANRYARLAAMIVACIATVASVRAARPDRGDVVRVEAADRFVDGMADVNAPICADKTAFSDTPSPGVRMEMAYLEALNIRHVRDAYLSCYHQSAFNAYWKALAARGTRLFATDITAYTDDDLKNARTVNPGLDAIGFGNEWDVERTDAAIGAPSNGGDTTISIAPLRLAHDMVPGQTYRIDDATQETFVVATPLSRTLARIRDPLKNAHASGTKVTRVGDFVDDVDDWLAYYAPRIRKYQPGFAVVGASLAFPIHAEAFSVPSDRTDGRFGLDAVEEHGYPAPMGSNPEGADGDGRRGYITVNHPPCSLASTSYTLEFNTCEARRQTGVATPIWITEYSYQVIPNGAAVTGGAKYAVPDRIGIAYLARSYFFASTHKRDRLYWFQMLDGTDGPSSGFCTYGLIDTGKCVDPPSSADPKPKGMLLTLGDLIAFFGDRDCRYPACRFTPQPIRLRWSDPSAPLEVSAYGWKNGATSLVTWLGARSYDAESTQGCRSTSACALAVDPRHERLSSPALRHVRSVRVRSIDTNAADPLPPARNVELIGGSRESIPQCPTDRKRAYYGCLTPATTVSVHDGSIDIDVDDVPKIVTIGERS